MLALAVAPVVLLIGYFTAQDEVQSRIDASTRRLAALWNGFPALEGAAPLPTDRRSTHIEMQTEFEFKRHLTKNISGLVLPFALTTALGVWLAFVALEATRAKRRRWAQAPTLIRVWRLSGMHLLGLGLWANGIVTVAGEGARWNLQWYRAGGELINPTNALTSESSLAQVLWVVWIPATALGSLILGSILICMGAQNRPFLQLSRVRSAALSVAIVGAGCVLFSQFNEWSRFMARATLGQQLPDLVEAAFRESAFRGADVARVAFPLGLALIVSGLLATRVVPARLLRDFKFLAGATECAACGHPLVGAQTQCPECGTEHAPPAASRPQSS